MMDFVFGMQEWMSLGVSVEDLVKRTVSWKTFVHDVEEFSS